jgi:hypothetical protein
MCTTFRSDHTTLSWFAVGSASEYSRAPNVARTLCCAGLHSSSGCAGGDPSSTRLGPACPTTPVPGGMATKALELVKLAQRKGYDRAELIALIDGTS